MNGLFSAAKEMQEFLQSNGWRFCFIGGLAVIRWSEPRMTQDVDLSLLTGFGSEETYIAALLSRFSARIADPEAFALRHRVLLLTASNGTAVDLSLAALPFEEEMIERATSYAFTPDDRLLTCSAEDLIVLKAFADREKDWMDIRGIVTRQKGQIDRAYIFRQLTPLCELKAAPHILEQLRAMLK